MKNFIAYEGEEFTIEWYYDSKGKSPAFEYLSRAITKPKSKTRISL